MTGTTSKAVRFGVSNSAGQTVRPDAVDWQATTARALFGAAERAFSHGCIRVAEPLDLAERLLAADGRDRARIASAVASGKTTSRSWNGIPQEEVLP